MSKINFEYQVDEIAVDHRIPLKTLKKAKEAGSEMCFFYFGRGRLGLRGRS